VRKGGRCPRPLAAWGFPGFRIGLGGLLCLNGAAARIPPLSCRLLRKPIPNPWGGFLVCLCASEFALSFNCARGGIPHCVRKTGPWGGAACFLVRHPVGVYGCAALPFCNTRLQPKLQSRSSCVYVHSFFCSVFFSALCLILLSQLCSCAVFRFYLPPPGPWHMYRGGRCSKDARQVLAMSLGSWACRLDACWEWSAAVDAPARVACPFFSCPPSLIIGLAATTKESRGSGRPFVFCSCSRLKCRGLVGRQRRSEGVASRCARLSLSGDVSERGQRPRAICIWGGKKRKAL
jgi:hypothetical protein